MDRLASRSMDGRIVGAIIALLGVLAVREGRRLYVLRETLVAGAVVGDDTFPMIVGGALLVLGAYLMLFPHARIKTLVPLGIFISIVYLPAWVLLLFWIGLQFLHQALEPMDPRAGGVAYAAHIGGFVAGFVLIQFFRKYRRRAHFRTY